MNFDEKKPISQKEIWDYFDSIGMKNPVYNSRFDKFYDLPYYASLKLYLKLKENNVRQMSRLVKLKHLQEDQKRTADECSLENSAINTIPDDEIKLSYFDYINLSNTFFSDLCKSDSGVLSSLDLLIQGTIPLRHVTILTDYNGKKYKAIINLFDNGQEIVLPNMIENGFISIEYMAEECAGVRIDEKVVLSRPIGHVEYSTKAAIAYPDIANENISRLAAEHAMLMNDKTYMDTLFDYVVDAWYLIQLCMLHPVIKYVLRKPKNKVRYDVRYDSEEPNNSGKRKAKNVRQTTLDSSYIIPKADDFAAQKGYSRRTIIWYVRGHYRHYENGKTVFVQGYWKGPMKEVKSAISQRERDIKDYSLPSA